MTKDLLKVLFLMSIVLCSFTILTLILQVATTYILIYWDWDFKLTAGIYTGMILLLVVQWIERKLSND